MFWISKYGCVVLCGVFCVSYCLYEDQIGKFDWKQKFVGKLKFSQFDSLSNSKNVIVATEDNVIAGVNSKSGEILWRQILENSSTGKIRFMHVDSYVVTVTGYNPAVVRGWNLSGGSLEFEWTLPSFLSDNQQVEWFIKQNQLYRVLVIDFTHLDMTSFNVMTGSKVVSQQIPIPWMSKNMQCRLIAPYLACLVKGDALYTLNLTASNLRMQRKPLSEIFPVDATSVNATFEVIDGSAPAIAMFTSTHREKQIVVLAPSGPMIISSFPGLPFDAKLFTASYEKVNILLQASLVKGWLELAASVLETGEQVTDLTSKLKYPKELGLPEISAALCLPRKDNSPGCRILLSTEDYAIALLNHPGKLLWVREEALASVVAIDMLDLPLSDADSAIEKEFDHKDLDFGIMPPGFLGMFVHRLTSQILQLYSLAISVVVGYDTSPEEHAQLQRDEFSLHKMIVIASEAGKLYGINTQNGDIVWQRRLEEIEPFSNEVSGKKQMVLFVQRSTRHFPYSAQCTLLAKHKGTNEGVLIVFNPFNGSGIGNDNGIIKLGYQVKQTLLLHQTDKEFLRGILLLDESKNLHIYPSSAREVLANIGTSTFMFTADPATGVLSGFTLGFSTEETLVASLLWEVKLTRGSQKITCIVGKNSLEKVHSQGRVLGDRSVLYKYNNPNLVAVVTQGDDPIHKFLLNIYLVDVVSGAVVFSVCHKKAHHPVHVVHSENWLVYSYFSEKSRRTEVASLEFYEGKTQSNTTAFSSINAPLQPIVDRQAYILPSMVEAMKETITEKGITSKHILVALPSGSVLELPWMYVDPRRPITVTAEMREEGVIPYMPELPIMSDHIINYNQSVHRVTGIHTCPSGLESTSLVLVYGLDLFYTRVAPSKTFDVLKEDFDHFLISTVLIGLITASYGSKKLASKKALKQAWK